VTVFGNPIVKYGLYWWTVIIIIESSDGDFNIEKECHRHLNWSCKKKWEFMRCPFLEFSDLHLFEQLVKQEKEFSLLLHSTSCFLVFCTCFKCILQFVSYIGRGRLGPKSFRGNRFYKGHRDIAEKPHITLKKPLSQ
jgi:hypothetical protein